MKFNRSLYSEEAGKQVQKAMKSTLKSLAREKINSSSKSCEECGQDALEPEIKTSNQDIKTYIKCGKCGQETDIKVDYEKVSYAID